MNYTQITNKLGLNKKHNSKYYHDRYTIAVIKKSVFLEQNKIYYVLLLVDKYFSDLDYLTPKGIIKTKIHELNDESNYFESVESAKQTIKKYLKGTVIRDDTNY